MKPGGVIGNVYVCVWVGWGWGGGACLIKDKHSQQGREGVCLRVMTVAEGGVRCADATPCLLKC